MKKEFRFKDSHTNIERLYDYAKFKFPMQSKNLEYDEWGQFVFFKKDEDVSIFYYIRATTGDLNYNVYRKQIAETDKPIIKDFKHRVYPDDKLIEIFDKILKPLY